MSVDPTVRVTVRLDRPHGPGNYRPDAWLDHELMADDTRAYRGVQVELVDPLEAGESIDVEIVIRNPNAWRPLHRGEMVGLFEGYTQVGTMVILEESDL